MKNNRIQLYKFTLGNPEINCRRYGICKIDDSDFLLIPTTLPQNTVWGMIETKSNTVVFRFLRNTMTDTTFKTHFSSGVFIIEKAVFWRDKIIYSGTYPLQIYGNEWIMKTDPSVFYPFKGLQNRQYFF
jgi:hypothetical protein